MLVLRVGESQVIGINRQHIAESNHQYYCNAWACERKEHSVQCSGVKYSLSSEGATSDKI